MNVPESAIDLETEQAPRSRRSSFVARFLARWLGPRFALRAFESSSIGLFLWLGALTSVQLGEHYADGGAQLLLLLPVGTWLGWLAADALSGAIHFAADSYGDPRWPVVGRALIWPFREHHADPNAILEHDFVERAGLNCAGAAGLLSLSRFLLDGFVAPTSEGALRSVAAMALFSAAIWIALTSEIHAWAHGLKAPRWAQLLQRHGIILPPPQHQRHHHGDHQSYYCITSGVWDRVLRAPSRSPSASTQASSASTQATSTSVQESSSRTRAPW